MSARPGARFTGGYPAADPYDRVPVTTAAQSAAAFDAAVPSYRPQPAGRHAGPGGAHLTPVMTPPPDRFPDPAPYPGRTPDPEPAAAADAAGTELGGDLAPTLHSGRAARRRQVARWKKSRRRAGVATAVALFGGGVTVASMEGLSSRGGATTSASHYDTVTPVSLRTADGGTSTPDLGTGVPGGVSAPTTAGHRHDGSSSPARTGGQATHPGTDSGGTTPIAPGTSAPTSYQQVRPAVARQPASTGTSGTQAGGSGGSGGTATQTGGGSTAATDTGSGSGSGSTTATGSNSGTQTGSGSGTSTATGTSTPPPATGTSPTDTPPQHGLCLLILCID